ncbi:putative SP-containing protein [Vairimorpha necatrix]|uniref:SP-containing protein n=1 Tax=Vairimorpha necatrix TaxID=6039 RepID=A0AAX4JDG5_9MICR
MIFLYLLIQSILATKYKEENNSVPLLVQSNQENESRAKKHKKILNKYTDKVYAQPLLFNESTYYPKVHMSSKKNWNQGSETFSSSSQEVVVDVPYNEHLIDRYGAMERIYRPTTVPKGSAQNLRFCFLSSNKKVVIASVIAIFIVFSLSIFVGRYTNLYR